MADVSVGNNLENWYFSVSAVSCEISLQRYTHLFYRKHDRVVFRENDMDYHFCRSSTNIVLSNTQVRIYIDNRYIF